MAGGRSWGRGAVAGPTGIGGEGAERAHWRELQKGGRGELAVWAASWAAARKLTQIGELLLGKLHRNVGIPGWYARSWIHRNGGAECWSRQRSR
jgi:hypothetical protein